MIDYGMNRRKPYWILAAILVISALSIYSFYESNISMPRLYQTSSMHQVHLKHKQGNAVRWELSADNAVFPTGKKVVYLKSPGITINHTPEIYLTAGSGIYEIEKEEITLTAPVELNTNGTKFTTETLKLNSDSETATTDDAVKYSGRDFLIEGRGLIANMKQKEIRIKNDIKATFYR
ncbi:MAG: LPS export ABC transporter periplasmic protein LptC [Nitrospirota bacterium]|nr:LPS export ABC transporter periplasmic protein LptC [Nitrospirota bacterium]